MLLKINLYSPVLVKIKKWNSFVKDFNNEASYKGYPRAIENTKLFEKLKMLEEIKEGLKYQLKAVEITINQIKEVKDF